MNTSEMWLTQEEIRLMLDGRLTWGETAGIAHERGLEDKRDRTQSAEGGTPLENRGIEDSEEIAVPDHRKERDGGFRLAGTPVIALVSGTGLLTFSLWFYLLLR